MEFGTSAQGTARGTIPPIPRMDPGPPHATVGEGIGDFVRQTVKEAKQAQADAKAAAKADRAAANADQAAGKTAQTVVGAGPAIAGQAPTGIPSTQPPNEFTFPTDLPPRLENVMYSAFVFVAVLVLGSQLLRIIARRMDKRQQPQPALAPDVTPQLRQLQESVDSMAIELERISEGQRFTTKLMSERLAAPALSEGEKRG